MHALGELAVIFPFSGAFITYNIRFIDPSWSFAMTWNCALQWLIILAFGVDTNPAAYCAVFYVSIIVIINFFGVKGYGEAELVFSLIKVLAVIGFIILSIVVYWHDPGAFNNGFKGLCSVFITAAFAFSGTELVGLARITLFYVVALILVGVLIPYKNPEFSMDDGTARYAPFVIGIKNAGISGLPSVMNVVIIISVVSVGKTIVRYHPPGPFGLICSIFASGMDGVAFDWMLAISGMCTLFTWGSICLSHIRFRRALKVQDWSNWLLLRSFLKHCAYHLQFWIALFPIGGEPNVTDFFAAYLSVPVILIFYIDHMIWRKN
ncbi:hypothetical protein METBISCDRAFT_29480 [Metschnikowia bicuspidata]|uniref:Amino acid permease/ SLC12A domain-containing protein n=1 Tax=Metschnikowia bicuspidata TaxID=27322 RepID=A0A4P9ZHT1_9ASCO|nr:hypothetical protein METBISCDRAFT_29480 [Metschnikowia bicuspidata]